jgi:ferric-dicitrate binding protein FerR (iron transport regulator)
MILILIITTDLGEYLLQSVYGKYALRVNHRRPRPFAVDAENC